MPLLYRTKVLSRRVSLGAFALVCWCGAPSVRAQSLGDIARQERARKNQQAPREDHVYDNDDLVRPHILVPEDHARAAASKEQHASTTRADAALTDAQNVPPYVPQDQDIQQSTQGSEGLQAETVSLGDIARHYRALKAQAKQKLDLGVPPNAQVTSMAFASEQRVPPAAATSTSQSGPAGTRVEPGASPRPAASSLLIDSFAVQTPSVNPAISRMEADVRPPRLAVPPPIAEQQSPAATLSERTGNPHRVRAQKGDTLWGLAAKYLGGGEAWPRLAAANPQLARPSLLVAGAWISLPAAPSLVPQRLVRVERGDSLSEIARAHFGYAAWQCLARANPGIANANLIRIGQLITLPDNCATPSASSIAARLAPEPLVAASPRILHP